MSDTETKVVISGDGSGAATFGVHIIDPALQGKYEIGEVYALVPAPIADTYGAAAS